jgi:transcriptional regulator with XRE-family HTH domain
MALQLGPTARYVRQSRGLSQRAAAEELGVSYVHLSNVERGRADPSTALVARFSTVFGVDLHVLAWCLFENDLSIPEDLRGPRKVLAEAWKKQLCLPVEAAHAQSSPVTTARRE